MNTSIKLVLTLCLGIGLGAAGLYLVGGTADHHAAHTMEVEEGQGSDAPLYWVAPMDPSYRRDGPGKSPMGMDLVPVFADKDASSDESGTVRISSAVANNLGVRSEEVARGFLAQEVRTVGFVTYNEDTLIHIHPRIEGWIEKLAVTAEGDEVKAGQPLYELYSPALVSAQEEYLLALKRNSASLIRAAEDRLKALQLPASQLATLREDKAVQQTVIFAAPQSGVVDELAIREGFFVHPETTLMSIGALDTIWVEAEVFAQQAALIEADQPVRMTVDFLPGKHWEGRVDYVYPALDPMSRTLRLRLVFDNGTRELRPHMFAEVVIDVADDQQALLVPKGSVIRVGHEARVVLDFGEGRYRSQPITPGRVGTSHIEVLDGLQEGDSVVTAAQFLLDSESSKQAEMMRISGDQP